MGYKYIVVIKDSHGRVIESVGTNNKYYAKWLCDVEAREHDNICKVLLLDEFEEDNFIL